MMTLLETSGKHQACPDGNHRRGMRATVSSPCREPKQLGGFKHAAGLLPWSGNGVWITVSRVDGCDWFVHAKTPFDHAVTQLCSSGHLVTERVELRPLRSIAYLFQKTSSIVLFLPRR